MPPSSRRVSPDGNRSSSDSADGLTVRELHELRAENAKLRESIAEHMDGSDEGRESIPGDSTPRNDVGARVSVFPSTLDV